MNHIPRTLSAVAFALGLLAMSSLHGGDAASVLRALSEEELTSFYLHCEGTASRTRPSTSDAALCSIAYELVLQRRFRGDFFAFLEWWRNTRQLRLEALFVPQRHEHESGNSTISRR